MDATELHEILTSDKTFTLEEIKSIMKERSKCCEREANAAYMMGNSSYSQKLLGQSSAFAVCSKLLDHLRQEGANDESND